MCARCCECLAAREQAKYAQHGAELSKAFGKHAQDDKVLQHACAFARLCVRVALRRWGEDTLKATLAKTTLPARLSCVPAFAVSLLSRCIA